MTSKKYYKLLSIGLTLLGNRVGYKLYSARIAESSESQSY